MMTRYGDVIDAFNEFVELANSFIEERRQDGDTHDDASMLIDHILDASMDTSDKWEPSMSFCVNGPTHVSKIPLGGLRKVDY